MMYQTRTGPRRPRRAIAASVAGLTLILASCGGSESNADSDTSAGGDGVLVIDESAAGASTDDAALVVADGGSSDQVEPDTDTNDGSSTDSASDGSSTGSTDSTESTESTESTDSTDSTDEEKALAFADCMRDEGIDWPDPTTNADGSIDPLGGRNIQELAGSNPGALQETAQVCSPLLDGASFLPEDDSFDAETEDALLDFAQCLRDEGLDVDDPDLSSGVGPGAVGSMFGPDFDPTDPVNADAIDACSALFAGAAG